MPTNPSTSGDTDRTPIDPTQPMPEDSLSTSATLVRGTPATVRIDGRADIFSAGTTPDESRGGKPNAAITLAAGGGALIFTDVHGKVGCSGDAVSGPDGGACAGGNTDLEAAGGISGIVHHERTQFLVGVFLADAPPAAAPPSLDFSASARGVAFDRLEPVLGQQFFIGDGATDAGARQQFVIPAGATRLFLGFADGFSFQGAPGYYSDNVGGFDATVTQQ